jgi:branched-chain amino acid transport system permease protein
MAEDQATHPPELPSVTHTTGRRVSLRGWIAAALIAALGLVPLLCALIGQPFYITLVSRMMIFALAIGLVCLRASGVGFIMITLAFAQMFYFLAVSLKQYGGDDGYALAARSNFGLLNLADNTTLYYVIYIVLILVLLLFHRLVNARFGMVLRGSKSNERRMRALGFPTIRFKLVAYVISALVCVLAGVLLANLTRFVSPSYMEWTVSGDILLMVVLGGVGTLVGPIVGAVVWLSLEEILKSLNVGLPWAGDEFIRNHWMAVLGLLVVVVTLTLKQGLYGFLAQHDESAR